MALALVAFSAASPAFAHSWYEPDCCGDGDCEMIPAERITPLANGNIRMRDAKGRDWIVVVPQLKYAPRVEFPSTWADPDAVWEAWRRAREADRLPSGPLKRASRDGEYHLCIYGGRVQCVYFPAER